MKRLLRALAAWRGRGLSPQGATARDSAFSLVELMELQHAMEAAEQCVDKAVLVSSGRAIQSLVEHPPAGCLSRG
jgi:hypothetical protein